jgi:hypothetical protein
MSAGTTNTPTQLPQLVYIVGCGRSGSTLLERMLGAVPGFANVGELIGLFPRVAQQDQRCGCGEPFSACEFWRAVGRQAYGGWEPGAVRHVAGLQNQVIRQRFVPYLLAGERAPAAFRGRLQEYVDAYASLYASIAEVSGARVLVDASKSPAQLLALRRIPGLDIRVVNLVRDSRGVAHSWNKAGITLPHVHDRQRQMRTYAPGRTALLWSTFQLESACLRAAAPHSACVRYEDLVASPRRTLERALVTVGMPATGAALDHVDDRGVTLAASHGVAGSRSRFTTGRVELRLDDEWRSALPGRARAVVTAMTAPQLLGYGYLHRREVAGR